MGSSSGPGRTAGSVTARGARAQLPWGPWANRAGAWFANLTAHAVRLISWKLPRLRPGVPVPRLWRGPQESAY